MARDRNQIWDVLCKLNQPGHEELLGIQELVERTRNALIVPPAEVFQHAI
jgi:hypothetical protein